MIKLTLLITSIIFFSSCMNRDGISLKVYTDCKEYYDFQGYYHKECSKDNIINYKDIGDGAKDAYDSAVNVFSEEKEEKIKPNVW